MRGYGSGAPRPGYEAAAAQASELLAEARAGSPRPVYLLCGADSFSRRQMLQALTRRLVPVDAEGGGTVFSGRETSAAAIADALAAPGFAFFDDNRHVVIVRDAPYFEPGQAEQALPLVQRINQGLPADTHLIIEAAGVAPKDRQLTKAVAEHGAVLEFPALQNEDDVHRLLRQRMRRSETKVRPAAVSELARRCGLDAWRLVSEFDKLSAYAGPGGVIDEALVAELVAPTAEQAVFGLVDRLSQRQVGPALAELDQLLLQGNAPLAVLAMLVRQVRLLLQARWLLDVGLVDRELLGLRTGQFTQELGRCREQWVTRAAGVLPLGARHCLLEQQPYPILKTLQQARSFDVGALLGALERLLQADMSLRSSHLEPEHVLELVVTDLCLRPEHGATTGLAALLTD